MSKSLLFVHINEMPSVQGASHRRNYLGQTNQPDRKRISRQLINPPTQKRRGHLKGENNENRPVIRFLNSDSSMLLGRQVIFLGSLFIFLMYLSIPKFPLFLYLLYLSVKPLPYYQNLFSRNQYFLN